MADREYTPAEVAQMRMAGIPADREGLGAEYPKMLYRKTDIEDRHIQTDASTKCGETYLVQNNYGGLLCDTMIVNSPDEAEALALEGWDVSPRAAHGQVDGLAKQVSAKDEEIAALRAQLAAQTAADKPETERRGPGRPPKVPEAA